MFMQLPFELRHLIVSECLYNVNLHIVNLIIETCKEFKHITHNILKKCNTYDIQKLSNDCCKNGMLNLFKIILKYHKPQLIICLQETCNGNEKLTYKILKYIFKQNKYLFTKITWKECFYISCAKNNLKIAKTCQLNCEFDDDIVMTALSYSCIYNHIYIVKWLNQTYKLNLSSRGSFLYAVAKSRGHDKLSKWLKSQNQ